MTGKIKKFEKDLKDCLLENKFEKRTIIILHVKLKSLKKYYNIPYDTLTKKILELLAPTKPKNIIVPSFTYSFTSNKPFDKANSISEVGVFSEIFRLQHSKYRTNDPIFSFCHIKTVKKEYDNVNFNAAFTTNSIWDYFYNKNVTILNIGLDHLVVSLIHYLEFIYKVPYRKLIKIKGTVISEKKRKSLTYDFYAREKNCIYALDWHKIEADLIKNNIMKINSKKNLNFKCIRILELSKFVEYKIKENPYYLVKKII